MIIGIGIDLVDIVRAARLVEGRDERQLGRLFTFREIDYARRHADPARHFAARLAAKEAAFKAMAGNELARAVGWRDIEVVSLHDGRPTLEFHGHGRRRIEQLGCVQALITLTHSDLSAAAVVLLIGPMPGAVASPPARISGPAVALSDAPETDDAPRRSRRGEED
jgi:holo-[acyl-carrier protein] synthase